MLIIFTDICNSKSNFVLDPYFGLSGPDLPIFRK